ncbi:hypothetical protein AMTRI_Chr01g133970 [Amborella trichopoda]
MKQAQRPGPNLASCIVATIFLIFLIIVLLILFFSLFKPKDPHITVNAIQIPAFHHSPTPSLPNGAVNFTFSQYVSVKNPNRSVFSHYDSTIQLIYAGNQVGFMFIPAGKIDGGRTVFMSVTFSVQSFPFMASQGGGEFGAVGLEPNLAVDSRMEIKGRVRVLHFFTHHVESRTTCRIVIAVNDGSVLGFHC